MDDRELIRWLMFEYEWNQEQLAEELGVTQPVISRVLNNRQALSRPVRKLAELLFEQIEEAEESDLDDDSEEDDY